MRPDRDDQDRAGRDRLKQDRGFRLVKAAMLVTDVAFLAYWTASHLTLMRQDTGRAGPDAAGAAVAAAPPGLQSRR